MRGTSQSFLSPLYYKFAEYSKNNRLFRGEIASTFYSVAVAIWIRALERPERSVESAIRIEKLRACRHNFNRVSQLGWILVKQRGFMHLFARAVWNNYFVEYYKTNFCHIDTDYDYTSSQKLQYKILPLKW